MKIKSILLIVILGTAACNVKQQNESDNNISTETDIMDGVEAGEDTSSTYRNKLIQAFEARQDHTQTQIDELKNQVAAMNAELSVGYKESTVELEEKQRDLEIRIETFKKASNKALKELKIGIDSAVANLERAIKKAQSEYKE